MKKLIALSFAFALAGCGVIPLPTVSIPDQKVTVTAPLMAGDTTVYNTLNTGASIDLPISSIRISGNTKLISAVSAGAVAEVYLAPSSFSGCQASGETTICPTPQGTLIGEVTVNDQLNGFSLGPNSQFGAAVKSGKLTIGLRLKSGALNSGDQIQFTNLSVASRL